MQDGKFVILCVDDDPDILETLKIVLEGSGYVFVGAASGEEGLAKFDESKPDLAMVDLMMEEVDAGTDMAKDLKERGTSVPIFMLSSVGDALDDTIDYNELGLAGVFQKPIDPAMLLKVIKAKLG